MNTSPEPDTDASDPSDASLLVRSAAEPSTFGVLFDRHADAVLAYFFRRTGCAQTSADLMAETFAAAFASRKRFRDTGAPARAWLFSIARRQLSHFYRREAVATKARRKLGVDQTVHLDDSEYRRIESMVDFAELHKALDQLPATQSEAVWLRIGHDLTYEEVAARLHCSEGAARVRVSRGLDHLAEHLAAPTGGASHV